MKVPVYGFEALKNFRFNTARPNTHIHVSSGLDWFDAKVEIEFGEQRVGITILKKRWQPSNLLCSWVMAHWAYLPDEWLKKYSLFLKWVMVKMISCACRNIT